MDYNAIILLIFSFFAIAILYASVGFGGGSSYISLLAIAGLPFLEIRSLALLCNIVVVSVSCLRAARQRQLVWKNIIGVCLFSIPAAYLGAQLQFSEIIFLRILGITLLCSALLMFSEKKLLARFRKNNKNKATKNTIALHFIGGNIGFLSGITGIGGGIFLSPTLHLTRYTRIQEIPLLCSFFILVNSISGVLSQLVSGKWTLPSISTTALLVASVIVGAFIGNHLRLRILKIETLRLLTALLVLIAGLRLLLK